MDVDSSVIHNCQKVEITQLFISFNSIIKLWYFKFGLLFDYKKTNEVLLNAQHE